LQIARIQSGGPGCGRHWLTQSGELVCDNVGTEAAHGDVPTHEQPLAVLSSGGTRKLRARRRAD